VSVPTSRWLIEERVAVQELDRVLDRDDVDGAVLVDVRIIAASVVDLPLPVMPVTSTSPRGESAISRAPAGS
jgi:hypothetical protein